MNNELDRKTIGTCQRSTSTYEVFLKGFIYF